LSRHTSVNDLIKRALMSAEIPSRLEPRSLALHDDTHPDGLSMVPWKNGRCLAWDFTCPDTLALSHLNSAVTGATEAEAKKREKYASISSTYHFVPWQSTIMETLGLPKEDAVDLNHELIQRITMATCEKRASQFLLQRPERRNSAR
jgi:hypothetical protein